MTASESSMRSAPIAVLSPINELVHRGAFDLEWRKVLSTGALAALGQWFIALSGMPIGLKTLEIINPILHLGFVVMLFIPIWLGYSVGAEKVLEGMAATARGARDIVAGALVGLIGGVAVSLLLVLMDTFDLNEPLVNCSVLIFSIFEAIISDLLKGFGLRQLDDTLYAKTGGLTVVTAIIVAAVAGLLAWFRPAKRLALREQLEALPDEKRRNANASPTSYSPMSASSYCWRSG